MELNKKEMDFSEITSPDKGVKWNIPMCLKCKYNKDGYCEFYKANRTETGVNIFECPSFVENEQSEKTRASNMFEVDLNG